ncbi:hypothetical protein [Bacillus testis]|uniref:hypothetical protein n=1 Tax=Bacillus testis TaxID=1622072 RepID=UPI001C9CA101|nr:hypothetical protein [Bacillus testis]
MDKPIWFESTPEQKTIFITLLMMANHQGKEWEWQGEKYTADPGQFITSLDSIVKNCGKGITIQNVRTALKRFEKYGFLTNQSTNKSRLITIVNWGIYQSLDAEANKQPTKQLTSNQQAINKELTPNKKERKQESKNEINKEHIPSQIENLRVRYSENQLKVIDDYLAIIVHTRTSGKISDSVILKMYETWDKHPAICVEYGLKTHAENPALHSKKENYTLGIIRNTSAEEAASKLNANQYSNVTPFRKKDSLFTQSEESKRRQAASAATVTDEKWQETLNELEEFPF